LGYADLLAPYDVIGSNVGLGVLAILLLIEVLADKVPGVDHVNDVINTIVRPAAGGVLTLANAGAGELHPGFVVLLGIITAGGVHATKATARPLVTATTGGVGNPIVSTIEDVVSFGMAIVALIAPIIVALFIILGAFAAFLLLRRLRRARAAIVGRSP
jgi:subtilisin family serine protease